MMPVKNLIDVHVAHLKRKADKGAAVEFIHTDLLHAVLGL
jgi:DNA-binding response OmpR family regulator